MIMLHELLFSPLVTKEDVLKKTFIRNKHFEMGLVSQVPVRRTAYLLIFKNKQKKPPWYIREIPEDANNVHVPCQYSKKG